MNRAGSREEYAGGESVPDPRSELQRRCDTGTLPDSYRIEGPTPTSLRTVMNATVSERGT